VRAVPFAMISVTDETTNADPLLKSRFAIPDRPPFVVTRPRLVERLHHSDAPVTVVVGPPGSGKTQLVASWVTELKASGAVAWITLEADDQACPFWTMVVAALRNAGLEISPSLASSTVATPVDRSFLVRLAAELTRLDRPALLVLDGVSDLVGTRWATELEFVLRHTAPLLRLVLIGRWDPPLPTHRYRLTGRLLEIRSADLAFTAKEADKLLSLHGVHLSPAKLSSLLEHTEGWAAGLRLFAMALQGRQDADSVVDTITGNEATIAEYFFDEVLRTQPAHVRSFLLDISILDTFTAELAEAVSGRADARGILAELERRNAFVQPTAEFSTVYRFHRLFAELLFGQLLCAAPERLRPLHHRAAAWFAERMQTAEAVGHAVKAADWDTAATVVIEHYAFGRLLIEGRTGRLGTLLHELPLDLDTPEAALVAAALALSDGSAEDCALHLRRVRQGDRADAGDGGPAVALADLLLRVLLADACGTEEQVLTCSSAAEQAMTHVPADQLARHPELTVLLLAAKGRAQSRQGAIDAAAVTFTRAIAQGLPDSPISRMECLEHLALIEAHRGRLGHAERLAEEAVDLADRCGVAPACRPVTAHIALAWVAMEQYDVDGAGHHLRIADQRRRPDAAPLTMAAMALVKSRRLQARGELRGAAKLLEDAGDEPRTQRWLAREIVLARAQLMITMGRPGDALRLIHDLPTPDLPSVLVTHAAALVAGGDAQRAREMLQPVLGAAGLPSPVAVEGWLVMATVAAHDGDIVDARRALGQALRHAIPEAQRRAVHQVWAQLRRLLRDDDELVEQHRVLQGAARGGRRPHVPTAGPVLVEPLSRREMDVLQGIAAMLPTEEIAARLFVSINTVKTHVRSILRKLSASRRNEAVRRARSLGLI